MREADFSCGVVCRDEGNGTSDEVGVLGDVVPRLKRFAHPLHFQSGVSADNTSCDVSSDSILRI